MESRHELPAVGVGAGVGDSHEPVVFSTYSAGSTKTRSSGQSRARQAKEKFPPLDLHLVEPEETTEEIIKGRRVKIMPSEEEHAEANSALDYLLLAHVRRGFIVATDLLTRVTWGSNFATDVCIRKAGLDPKTKCRHLEEVAFEIVNKQRMSNVTDKADELTYRGVRRVFAVFVRKNQIGEWSKEQRKFVMVDLDASLKDRVLVRPLAFKALLDSAIADHEVVQALAVKKSPAILAIRKKGERKGRKIGITEGRKQGIVEGRKQGIDEGRKQGIDEGRKQGIDEGRQLGVDEGKLNGRRETLLEQLEERFGKVPARWRKCVLAADLDALRRFSKKLLSSPDIAAVFQSK